MAQRDFLLPDLGEGLEEAEIVTWRVAEGDRVALNQPLVEVDTAKALVEIPSPLAGLVIRLHGAPGDVVKVGAPLVTIALDDAAVPASAEEGLPEVATQPVEGTQGAVGAPRRRAVLVGYGVEEEQENPRDERPQARRGRRRSGREGPVRTSPPVRRLARDLGVDLASVTGTGPDGRITREDVQRAAEAAPAGEQRGAGTEDLAPFEAASGPAAEVERVPVRGVRRLIAEKMARSAREIPHVTTFLTVDATAVEAFRDDLKAELGNRISPLPILVRALIEVCGHHPKLNASFDAEASEMLLFRTCNIGIATDTERGLLVPVIRDARRLGLRELSAEIARLVQAARSATIGPEDLIGGTITVTNVGTFGSEFGTPLINHPEGAILALGVVQPRALVVDGRVEARPAVTLSLSFDHRLLDGAEAGRALRSLGDLLESPFRLGALPR
jgi:2-oxoisovalerate dehydrogenase E2 component (dihydrolipoyl transacylase)